MFIVAAALMQSYVQTSTAAKSPGSLNKAVKLQICYSYALKCLRKLWGSQKVTRFPFGCWSWWRSNYCSHILNRFHQPPHHVIIRHFGFVLRVFQTPLHVELLMLKVTSQQKCVMSFGFVIYNKLPAVWKVVLNYILYIQCQLGDELCC